MSKPVTPDSKKKKSHPEARGLMLIAGSLLTLLCLLSFEIGHASKNWLGLIGYFLSFGLTYLFGLTPFFAVVYVGWLGWKLITQKEIPHLISSVIYFSIFCISCCLLLNLLSEAGLRMPHGLESKTYTETVQLEFPYPHRQIRHNLGGVPFYLLYRDLPTLNLQRLLSDVGIGITFSVAAMVSLLLATQTPIIPLLKKLANGALFIRSEGKRVAEKLMTPKLGPLEKQPPAEIEKRLTKVIPQPLYESEPIIRTHAEREEMPKPTKRQAAISAQKIVNGDYTTYKLPSPNLLSNGKKVDHPSLKKELRRQAEILEETLMSFGIEAKVGEINCGPTITSFEVHPAIGVKVQKIKTLENDIALNLQAKSIRIIAPIPGKAAVGVEIPSLYPQEVSFKEMLLDYQQSPRKLFIPVLLGKNVTG